MITPTFEPEGKPGEGIAAYSQGMEQAGSWMERNSRMATQEQNRRLMQQEEQVNNILLPVKIAQAEADEASAKAKVVNAHTVEQFRRQAAEAAPIALREFLDLSQEPDLDRKAAQLDAFAAKYSWLGNVPENKSFIDTVNDARGKAHIDSIAMGKIAQAKEAANQRAQTGEAQIEQRAKAAELKATTEVQKQAADLAHKREVDELNLKIKSMESDTKRRGQDTAAATATQRPANQMAVKANEALLETGRTAATELVNTDRALEILADPAFRTGTGAQFALSAKRLGGLLGFDVGDAPKAEELQSKFGDILLSKAKQMKGNFSDKDREAIERFSPSLAKTPEGNRALMTVVKAGYERQVKIAKMVNELRQEGASEREIQLEVNDFILNSPTSTGLAGSPASGAVIKSVKKIE